jgi:NAD+ diphosphatase
MPHAIPYESCLHLPFNSDCLKAAFRPATPDRDPGGDGVWLPMQGMAMCVRELTAGTFQLPAGELPADLRDLGLPLFIGTWQDAPCRMLRFPRDREVPAGWSAQNLLAVESPLPIELLSLGGIAAQILHWERNSRYCSRCGSEMDRLPGEWGKSCRGCGYAHFPHIHPCVIVLVRRPGEVLLTRKAGWQEGRYGLVAGFLDFGECLEEAVAREVLEETGVQVNNVRYVGSQCWPFPSQLMAGFVADYAGGEIQVDGAELEDARWFPVNSLPILPPRRSIARYLLDHYCAG